MDSHISAHADFLNDAAYLMRLSAPETSAYLMDHRNGLLSANGVEFTARQQQHVCAACGHIMIPGYQSEIKLMASKRLREKKPQRSGRGKSAGTAPSALNKPRDQRRLGSTKKFECGLCHESTMIDLGPAPRISRQRRRTKGSDATTAQVEPVQMPASTSKQPKATGPSSTASAPKSTSNASSKKRAKNRKAGLQALLSQSSQTTRSLSLADLARK